jgi:hypothetical protein
MREELEARRSLSSHRPKANLREEWRRAFGGVDAVPSTKLDDQELDEASKDRFASPSMRGS